MFRLEIILLIDVYWRFEFPVEKDDFLGCSYTDKEGVFMLSWEDGNLCDITW